MDRLTMEERRMVDLKDWEMDQKEPMEDPAVTTAMKRTMAD